MTSNQGADVRVLLDYDIPTLTMTEQYLRTRKPCRPYTFTGRLGSIDLTTSNRLPRHIHMDLLEQKLIAERIMVFTA
jgi:hypothetical protein